MTHRTLTTLFFAGTDTEVGKTYAAALVVRRLRQLGRRVGVYKPVASGCYDRDGELVSDDALHLWQAAGQVRSLREVCPQCFIAPLAPPEAAAKEGRTVDARLLREGAACWESNSDVLIVEGAGGLLSPLAEGVLNIDLAAQFDAALIIVAANRLGAIHQTLATCDAAIHRGIRPCGIMLSDTTGQSDAARDSNATQIRRYTDVPVIAEIPSAGTPQDVDAIQTLVH